jgi:hypothetical protein
MNYWTEVKRIQVSMRSVSIYTAEATKIINGITGKYGYFFTIDSIYKAVPIEEIKRMISGMKEKGGTVAALAAGLEEFYKDEGPFVCGEELTEAEISDNEPPRRKQRGITRRVAGRLVL